MKNSILLGLLLFILMPCVTHAATYTTTNDLFENSYTNNLIDMAQTQIDSITTKKYVIIQNNYDYYLITAKDKDVTVSGNNITMNNSKIIKVVRTQSGYNYYYDYDTYEEVSTTVHLNNISISNIDTSNSVSCKRFDDYLTNKNIKYLLMFILGITFAIFVTKERSF